MYSPRASSVTSILFSDGMAAKSKLSRLFTTGNFAARMRRSTILRSRSIIRHAIVTAQGVEPLLYPRMGGSLPNYVFTKILGIPSFVVP
jgi:hypothetical protein